MNLSHTIDILPGEFSIKYICSYEFQTNNCEQLHIPCIKMFPYHIFHPKYFMWKGLSVVAWIISYFLMPVFNTKNLLVFFTGQKHTHVYSLQYQFSWCLIYSGVLLYNSCFSPKPTTLGVRCSVSFMSSKHDSWFTSATTHDAHKIFSFLRIQSIRLNLVTVMHDIKVIERFLVINLCQH